jgi:polyisoprenoid-binding protein YceI
VTIDAASINTREAQRDGHLRSADFFDVEKYPHITFKSTQIVKVDDQHGIIHGDLTIKNITRPVQLDTIYSGMAKSPFGHSSAGFSASTEINRKDWDLSWNVALETGGWLVSDTIRIDIAPELIKEEKWLDSLAHESLGENTACLFQYI